MRTYPPRQTRSSCLTTCHVYHKQHIKTPNRVPRAQTSTMITRSIMSTPVSVTSALVLTCLWSVGVASVMHYTPEEIEAARRRSKPRMSAVHRFQSDNATNAAELEQHLQAILNRASSSKYYVVRKNISPKPVNAFPSGQHHQPNDPKVEIAGAITTHHTVDFDHAHHAMPLRLDNRITYLSVSVLAVLYAGMLMVGRRRMKIGSIGYGNQSRRFVPSQQALLPTRTRVHVSAALRSTDESFASRQRIKTKASFVS